MGRPRSKSVVSAVLLLSGVFVVPAVLGSNNADAGQASSAKPGAKSGATWKAPRAADGHPDLNGVWSYATITPLERPADLGDKAVLTMEEAAEYEKRLIALGNKDARGSSAEADVASAYNDFWWDRGTNIVGTRRTSLIVDPANGRIPALTE
ncbi:MAG: hypothetical protein ABL961_04685, partial [Vicinamibacterales bacterium]